MRCKISIKKISPSPLHYDYQYGLSSMLYAKLATLNIELADKTHSKRGFKFYTFSNLILEDRIPEKNGLNFRTAHFFLSSPDPDFIRSFAEGLLLEPDFLLGNNENRSTEIYGFTLPVLLFFASMKDFVLSNPVISIIGTIAGIIIVKKVFDYALRTFYPAGYIKLYGKDDYELLGKIKNVTDLIDVVKRRIYGADLRSIKLINEAALNLKTDENRISEIHSILLRQIPGEIEKYGSARDLETALSILGATREQSIAIFKQALDKALEREKGFDDELSRTPETKNMLDNYRIRRAAAGALGDLEGENSVKPLIELLKKEEDYSVINYALTSLVILGATGVEVNEVFLNILKKGTFNSDYYSEPRKFLGFVDENMKVFAANEEQILKAHEIVLDLLRNNIEEFKNTITLNDALTVLKVTQGEYISVVDAVSKVTQKYQELLSQTPKEIYRVEEVDVSKSVFGEYVEPVYKELHFPEPNPEYERIESKYDHFKEIEESMRKKIEQQTVAATQGSELGVVTALLSCTAK